MLAGMSLPVIGLIHMLVSTHFDNPWKVTAAAAVAVGVVHGTLAWAVRSRQRAVRLQLLRRIWTILQDELEMPDGEMETSERAMFRTDGGVRLALAQLPALLREPVVVRTMSLPKAENQPVPPGLHA